MNTSLKQIDDALDYLRAQGVTRTGGVWLTPDGVVLAADPVAAVKALRHLTIQRAVETERAQNQRFTR